MRIYVGTYKKYGEGSLGGKWLDLEDYADHEDFIEACKDLHADEEDPELMFQDWEDLPEGTVTECSVDEDLWDFIKLDQPDREMVEAFMKGTSSNLSHALEHAHYCFLGRWESMAEYAYETFRGTAPEAVQGYANYIDFERMGKALELDGLFLIDEHLFSR